MTAEEQAEVQRVVALVLQRVRRELAGTATTTALEPAGPRVLAIFTAGRLGLDAALQQLSELRAGGWRIDCVLSERAAALVPRERLAGMVEVPPPEEARLEAFLEPYAAVLVPALDRSSAARLAVGITDTPATETIWQALMLGKPVIAARNAADPASDCPATATRRAPEAARRLVAGHLDRLAELGIALVDAGELASAARSALGQATAVTQERLPRTIITGEDVRRAAEAGQRRILAGAGSQVTHVARDQAKKLGVRIEIET